jgi:outer membrane protein OmpA-like peptidoglycan-associated protein
VRSKRLSADAIINPYALINSAVLEELSKRSTIRLAAGSEQKVNFPALGEAIWTKLRVLGSLNVDPVTFRAGDNLLDDGGNAAVDKIAELLLHNYSGLRVEIRGHTGPGSEAESLALSLERAEVVAKHLSLVHNINTTRLNPVGMGFKQPLPRKPNEPTRAYNARLPRVEFVLLEAGSGL